MKIGELIRLIVATRKGELEPVCECGDRDCGNPVPSCCNSCDPGTCGCGR